MNHRKITFGTDGWRAIIADDYTFDNVALVAQATAVWMKKTYPEKLKTVIGYDARFMGDQFARHTARIMASMGIEVILSDGVVTTPAVSYAALKYGCGAGVVITASHNPPAYNGFKIKSEHGGPASPDQVAEVEALLPEIDPGALEPVAFDDLVADGRIIMRDLGRDYLELLREKLDIEAIKKSGIRIAHDAMFGAAKGVVTALLGEAVVALHDADNPGFLGQAPEPIEKNLKELSTAVVSEGCGIGLANDGDGDRIGLYDENGDFVDSHRTLALLLKYLHEEKGLSGDVVRTFSTTDLLGKMASAYGLKIETTPIGFKYIAPKILEGDVLVGGEESGGLAVKGHIPERDGVFIGLLIVEMMVKRGKKLSELVQELFDEFGPHFSYRNDLHTTDEKKQAFLNQLESDGLSEVAGFTVTDVETLDGFKFRTDAGNWVMVRPSGTEPVLRIYSEAADPETAESLVRSVADRL